VVVAENRSRSTFDPAASASFSKHEGTTILPSPSRKRQPQSVYVPEHVFHAPKAQRPIRRWNSDIITNITFFSFPSFWVTASNLQIKVTAFCHRRSN
jgi:hypothetical protein